MKDITHWKIILPGAESFDYSSNMADFEVLEDFDLARIDFSGVDDMPIADAAAMTKAICLALKIPATGFDEYVSSLDVHAKFNEHPQGQEKGWGQRTELGDIWIDVAFVMRPFMDHTSAQVNITIEWRDYLPKDWWKAPRKKLIANLQPPPGYEGVSMASPPRDPNQKGVPAHDFSYYKQKLDEFKKQQLAAGNITAAQLAPHPPIVIPPVPGAEYIAGKTILTSCHTRRVPGSIRERSFLITMLGSVACSRPTRNSKPSRICSPSKWLKHKAPRLGCFQVQLLDWTTPSTHWMSCLSKRTRKVRRRIGSRTIRIRPCLRRCYATTTST